MSFFYLWKIIYSSNWIFLFAFLARRDFFIRLRPVIVICGLVTVGRLSLDDDDDDDDEDDERLRSSSSSSSSSSLFPKARWTDSDVIWRSLFNRVKSSRCLFSAYDDLAIWSKLEFVESKVFERTFEEESERRRNLKE